jgi:peptide-methionine (S)-S-oxide reductase
MNEESKMSKTAKNRWWFALLALAAVGAFWNTPGRSGEAAVMLPAPALDNAKAAGPMQTAVLAGGCFWGVQGVYQYTKGVKQVLSGYSGGDKSTAEYEKVGTGRTGHAESVQIVFDPKEISYGEILRIYFSVAHDPTQLDRQGPDVGTQYRSAIFYANETQRRTAQALIDSLTRAHTFNQAIVTQVAQLSGFFAAEAYHQDYAIEHPLDPYIFINDRPKVGHLRDRWPQLFQAEPIRYAP